MKTLFTNCKVLLRDKDEYVVLENAYLSVNNDLIDYIGIAKPNRRFDYIKDLEGDLIMPGLVNAHGHAPMTLLRGVGHGLSLQDWLNKAIFPIEAKMTPEDIYKGALYACAEMIEGGTTSVSEMYDFPYSSALAFAKSGLKASICRVGLCFNPNEDMYNYVRLKECKETALALSIGKPFTEEARKELKVDSYPTELIEAINSKRIQGDLCLHSEYLTTPSFVKEIAEYNKDNKYHLQVHVSETKKEHEECKTKYGLTPFGYLEKMGILKQGSVYAAHCVHIDDNDLKIMKKNGVTLVHNPTSNLKLNSGIAQIHKAIKAGVNVALGTDGCSSNNNLNMFEEMHIAALLANFKADDPTAVSVTNILDMATVNGAKALGRNDTGVLEVGKKADIIVVSLKGTHMSPAIDIPSLLVYSAQSSDVRLTMVDGKILYEDGKFLTIDIDKAKQELLKSVNRLLDK